MWRSKREKDHDLDCDRKGPQVTGSVAQKPWLETRSNRGPRLVLDEAMTEEAVNVPRGSEDVSQRVPQIEQLVA